MLYRGYFSLAHWSKAGEQFWVRYCAEFHTDVFQSGGGVLRQLAAQKMLELNADGICIENVDLISDQEPANDDHIDCLGIYSRAASGGEQIEFRV